MKKSKILIVAVLALLLCFVCVTTSTFSWFTRPQTKKGDSLGWNINYDISVGNGISMATYSSTDDGKTYGDTPVTAFSNTGISAGSRVCYRTDIKNSGASAQSVSLYLSELTFAEGATGNFYLGVNSPLKTYKNYHDDGTQSDEKVGSIVNKKNIYVGFNTNQTYTPTNYQVHWWDSSDSSYNGDSNVNAYFRPNKTGDYANSTYNMTYATIPWNSNSVILHQGGTYYGSDNTDIVNNNTIIMWQKDAANFDATYEKSDTAAGINTFYSTANISVGSTISIAAEGQATLSYSSSDSTVASVDSSGNVKGLKAGSTTITVTSTGIYGDKITSDCLVTVKPAESNVKTDVPIVTNVKVPENTVDNGDGVVSVYWYIKNDTASGNLAYTINSVYLTL